MADFSCILTEVKALFWNLKYCSVVVPNKEEQAPKEASMLAGMVSLYCASKHPECAKSEIQLKGILGNLSLHPAELCRHCARLLNHGLVRLKNCPYDPKPSCKHCPTPCFSGEYRDFIKLVMRYSGLKLIKSGRLDLIFRYLF